MLFRRRNRRVLSFAAEPLERDALIRVILPFELHADAQQAALRAGREPIRLGRSKWQVVNRHYGGDHGLLVTFEFDATRVSEHECEALLRAAEPYATIMSDQGPSSSRTTTRQG